MKAAKLKRKLEWRSQDAGDARNVRGRVSLEESYRHRAHWSSREVMYEEMQDHRGTPTQARWCAHMSLCAGILQALWTLR